MMGTNWLVIIMLFFFGFAPLCSAALSWQESASLIGKSLYSNLDVNSQKVMQMAGLAIDQHNNRVNGNLRLVQVLSCKDVFHTRTLGSSVFDLVMLVKDKPNKTNKYLVRVYQKRSRDKQLIHQTVVKFELIERF
ncbi:hypothetical protein HN51_065091 [Arachis hypogaea]